MREIPLTKGYVAIVDDEDYERVASIGWAANIDKRRRTVYASHVRRDYTKSPPRVVCLSLHRVVMSARPGDEIDHIDGNGLDCRKGNLRLATRSQNFGNRMKRRDSRARFKGVSASTTSAGTVRWSASIRCKNKVTSLGAYGSDAAAARAYDAAARRLFGPFAAVNFPEEGERSALTGEIRHG